MNFNGIRSVLLGSGAAVAMIAAGGVAGASEIDELRSQIDRLKEKMSKIERSRNQRRRVAPAAAVEAGSKPRSWKLPGTNTSMVIGGYAKLDLIYDINGAGGDAQAEAALPLDGQPAGNQQGNFRLHARQSRIFIRTWTPTDWGELATHIEGDFFGGGGTQTASNSNAFRLRRAYGSLGPVLAGQTWSTFMILEGLPNTLDFGGPPGQIFVRQAQIRYTHSFGGGTSIQFAVENPETPSGLTVLPVAGATGAADPAAGSPPDAVPDFILKLTHRWSGGQASIAGLVRYMEHNNGGAGPVGAISSSALAWGVHAGVGWRFNRGRTAIGGTVYGGRGIGRYSGQGTVQAVLNGGPGGFDLDPVLSIAGQVWIQHRITNTVRLNAGYGREWVDVTGENNTAGGGKNGIAAGTNQDLWRGWVNAIWNPVPQVNIGVEYMYSFRGALNGPNGTGHRIQAAFQYNF